MRKYMKNSALVGLVGNVGLGVFGICPHVGLGNSGHISTPLINDVYEFRNDDPISGPSRTGEGYNQHGEGPTSVEVYFTGRDYSILKSVK